MTSYRFNKRWLQSRFKIAVINVCSKYLTHLRCLLSSRRVLNRPIHHRNIWPSNSEHSLTQSTTIDASLSRLQSIWLRQLKCKQRINLQRLEIIVETKFQDSSTVECLLLQLKPFDKLRMFEEGREEKCENWNQQHGRSQTCSRVFTVEHWIDSNGDWITN